MQEASKTNKFRPSHFASTYLSGRVLDIGAGPDLVCPHALAFDQEHGDANKIDEYFEAGSFDTVHSSHSLEHMLDPVQALHLWWSLVKSGGFLIVVVQTNICTNKICGLVFLAQNTTLHFGFIRTLALHLFPTILDNYVEG